MTPFLLTCAVGLWFAATVISYAAYLRHLCKMRKD